MSETGHALPPVAAVVTHPVADFDAWKAAFDAHEPARRASGIVGHHINRAEDDPNLVTVYFAVVDPDKVAAFAESDDLVRAMQEAGVTGPPEIMMMTPVRQSIVWDRELPAMIVTHSVTDFDHWLEGYDAAAELRTSKGIIGHAANRSLDDPSLVVVYHQAESFATLRAFLEAPEPRRAMEEAGVSSEPAVAFFTGGWAKQYE